MFKIIKKIFTDLLMWFVNRIKYVCFYLYACWKTRYVLYYTSKYQAFIVIFGGLSLFCLGTYYAISDIGPDFFENYAVCFKNNIIFSIFSFLTKSVMQVISSWFDFIKNGTNLAAIYAAFITLYCFIFSQQKEIVSASTTISDWRIIPLIVFLSIPNILKLNNYCIKTECVGERQYNFIILITFIIGSWFVFHIGKTISRINVVNLFEYLLNYYFVFHNALVLVFGLRIKRRFLWSFFIENEYCKTKVFNLFIRVISSINQILIYFVRNELIGIFHDKYDRWMRHSYFLNISKNEDSEDKDTVAFIEYFFKKYHEFYKTTLRCQYVLIRNLYDKSFIAEGYLAVQDFFKMLPYSYFTSDNSKDNVTELYKSFLLVVLEISLYFYNRNISLLPVLKNIKTSILPENLNDVISIYRVLLIKASEKQDEKAVISLSYDLMQTITDFFIMDIAPVTFVGKENITNEKERYSGIILYIYLCVAIKSIELGYKNIVSFMVKFIISEFQALILYEVLLQLKRNLPNDYKFDSHDIGNSIGIHSFNIKDKTCEYCFEKLAILLYGQQLFVMENDINFSGKIDKVFNIEEFLSDNYLYVYEKVCQDSYNLLWMKEGKYNENYRKDLEKRLKLIYGSHLIDGSDNCFV